VAKTRFRGKPAIIGSAVDITDQKKFEEELQHASNLLKEKVQERTSELEASNKSLRDEITERKHIEKVLKDYTEKLEMTNKELKDFAFIASHDMREPLRKISQFGDLISSKFAPLLDEKGQDYFQRMIDAANRMQELLDDLLQYSRVSQYDILFKTVDLNKIIDQVSADYDLAIQDKKATLQVDELLDIKADPTQIYQLFQNLIDNALKFGNEKPVEINIHGELIPANDENAEVEYAIFVEDNGPGFDKKHNEEIFAPFKRLYGRGKYTGTGMGLALCRKIVERHNGKITVESEPGEGTTFKIVLPLRQ
jgi:light-regulated signal transduction histidine kinase (bacteriophytochrome)